MGIMRESGIVPEFVDEEPTALLSIKYPNGLEVNQGAELTPTQVKDEPTVKWAADAAKYYTLLMFDPDTVPIAVSIKHWLVVNILGDDLHTGEVLAGYRGSGAPKGSGLHRYIFLIFEQKAPLDVSQEGRDDRETVQFRRGFNVKEFVRKYDLVEKPVAGDFFRAQWDPYVDEKMRKKAPA